MNYQKKFMKSNHLDIKIKHQLILKKPLVLVRIKELLILNML